MSAPTVVHEMPPAGGSYTSCCLTLPAELPLLDVFTRDTGRVTCTVRDTAELAVDTDRGESPFGWSAPLIRAAGPLRPPAPTKGPAMKVLRLTPEQTEAIGRQMARAAEIWRQLADAFRAMARQLVRTLSALTQFVQRHQTAHPVGAATARRPAWMSPYGPPTGRHRRR